MTTSSSRVHVLFPGPRCRGSSTRFCRSAPRASRSTSWLVSSSRSLSKPIVAELVDLAMRDDAITELQRRSPPLASRKRTATSRAFVGCVGVSAPSRASEHLRVCHTSRLARGWHGRRLVSHLRVQRQPRRRSRACSRARDARRSSLASRRATCYGISTNKKIEATSPVGLSPLKNHRFGPEAMPHETLIPKRPTRKHKSADVTRLSVRARDR